MGISDTKIIAQERIRVTGYLEAENYIKTLTPTKRQKGQFAMRHFPAHPGVSDGTRKSHERNCVDIDRMAEDLSIG